MTQPDLCQVWLLDCGNTAWKWARADAIADVLRSPPGRMPQAIQPSGDDVLVYLPTAAAATAEVAALNWPGSTAGLGTVILGCPGYATHGLDRQAGGFAVQALGKGTQKAETTKQNPCTGAIVVDAGTAITADAWLLPAGADLPTFLGGWIIPGHQAGMAGLATAAPALPQPSATIDRVGAVASADQLAVGPAFGWPAMVQSLVAQLQRDHFDHPVPLVLTGGDQQRYQPTMQRLADDLGVTMHLEPQLVFAGMVAWWQQ